MRLTNLTVSDLKKIQKWLARKERLVAEVAQIDRLLDQFESSSKRGDVAKSAPGRRRPGRSGRGKLKEKIVRALQSAGSAGLHIKDVAAKVKNKEANVRIWFFTTGKKIKSIKRVGPAKYRWQT